MSRGRPATPCERCGAPFPKAASRCPSCGVSSYVVRADRYVASRAQGRALNRLSKEFPDAYRRLYLEEKAIAETEWATVDFDRQGTHGRRAAS